MPARVGCAAYFCMLYNPLHLAQTQINVLRMWICVLVKCSPSIKDAKLLSAETDYCIKVPLHKQPSLTVSLQVFIVGF